MSMARLGKIASIVSGCLSRAPAQAGRLILDPLCQHRALSPLRDHAGGSHRKQRAAQGANSSR